MGQQNSTAAKVSTVTHSDVTFIEHNGRITEGGDLMRTSMTISEAKRAAAAMAGCQGFCFLGTMTEEAVEVWFKNKCTSALCLPFDKWTTIQVLRDPPVPDIKPQPPEPAPEPTRNRGEPDYDAQGILEFEADGHISDGYTGGDYFQMSVKSEHSIILTCIQEADFISCMRLSGDQSFQLKVPDGQEPFGSWLLPAVKETMGSHSGLLCLIDREGAHLAKEEPAQLEGEAWISGSMCVKQHFTAGWKASGQQKAFAAKPKGMKRLRKLLSEEDRVAVSSTSESWANDFGKFSREYVYVRGAGLLIKIFKDVSETRGL